MTKDIASAKIFAAWSPLFNYDRNSTTRFIG